MKAIWLLLFCLLGSSKAKSVLDLLSPVDRCIALIRGEIAGKNVSRNLGGIVGVGWNDLTNQVTLPVLSITYQKCLTVPDGDFFIPDNVMVIPKKEVQIEKTASSHSSYESVKHTDSQSISGSAGGGAMGVSASASFSLDMQQAKEHMSSSTQSMTQKRIEYYAFDMIANENSGFDLAFTQRLESIAKAILDDNLLLAQFKAEDMINDYGTHVVHKAAAGASVTLRTFMTFKSEQEKEEKSIEAGASVSAEGYGFKASVDTKIGNSDKSQKGSNDTKMETFIITKGGPDVNKLLRPTESDDMLAIDSLVGLKQEGMFIYSMIHPGVLEGYDEITMNMVHELLRNATEEFYRHNTIPGCTNVSYINYNHRANVEDGSCNNNTIDFGFGGVYQQCEYLSSVSEINQNHPDGPECEKYQHKNPFANSSFRCPDDYIAEHINQFYANFDNRIHIENTTKHCNFITTIFGCSPTNKYIIHDTIKISAFWCKKTLTGSYDNEVYRKIFYKETTFNETFESEVLFGGIFENDNVFSDDSGCPTGFHEYPFLHTLKICMARKNVNLKSKSVAFHGIKDCQSVEQECIPGYSRYFAATIDNCAYYYCASILDRNGIKTLPKLSRPPYIDRNLAMSKTRSQFRQRLEEMQEKAAKQKESQNAPSKLK